jgi:hypothetical protein
MACSLLCRELAELLGQVKPPTASKEEIDKSGLEVIKADSLEEYAKDGRVATNCADRVWNHAFAIFFNLAYLAYSVSYVLTTMCRTMTYVS